MSGNLSLISQYEIARQVAVALMEQNQSITNKQTATATVVKLIATFAKFVTHFFKKIDKNNSVACEVPMFGNFVLEREENEQLKYSFVPSSFLINESNMQSLRKSVVINKLREPIVAKQLSMDKLAQLSNMDVDSATQMQTQLIKTISKNLKQQFNVALDLKFGNGNYMVLTQNEGILFQSKLNIIESYSGYASTVPSIQSASQQGFRSSSQVRSRDIGDISDVKSVIHGKLSEFATPREMVQKSAQGLRTRNNQRRVLSISLARTVGKSSNHLKSQVANQESNYDLEDRFSQKSARSRMDKQSQISKKSQSFASMIKSKLQQSASRQPSRQGRDIFSNANASEFKASRTQEFGNKENRTSSVISNYNNLGPLVKPEDARSNYSAFNPPKSAKSTTRKLPSTRSGARGPQAFVQDRNLQNSNHKKRLEQLLQVNANTSHQWRKDREVELYQNGLGDELIREDDTKSRTQFFTKTLKERFQAIRERSRLDPAGQTEQPTKWERGLKGAPPIDINKRTKDLGLMAHALFQADGPINQYTQDCDTHYKVQYLLLKRDLQGQAVQENASKRLEDQKLSLKDDVCREKKEFYDQIEHHKMLTTMKKQQHRETQKNYRDFWSQQIQDRQEKEFQDRIDDMFAPNGSPMAYNFKQDQAQYESQFGGSPQKDLQDSNEKTKPSARDDTSSRRPKTQESSRSRQVNINSFRPLHKFAEYMPKSGSYAYPIQDGDRTASQLDRDNTNKKCAREALLEQMKYNKLRDGIERQQELIFGQKMVANAHNSLVGEAEFLKVKRDIATKTMRDQWTAVQKNQLDHTNINKIFE